MLRSRSLVLLAVALSVVACRKKQPPAPTPTETQTSTPSQPMPTQPQPTTPDRSAFVRDSIAAAERARAAVRSTLEEMVFFDYDQFSIRDDARATLERKVPILRTNSNVTLRVEGHADERGSVEYNLALSLRRANSIRDFLGNFGIDAGRVEVVGLGEERPLDSGTSEAAYQRNRRGEFHITRGGESLMPPR